MSETGLHHVSIGAKYDFLKAVASLYNENIKSGLRCESVKPLLMSKITEKIKKKEVFKMKTMRSIISLLLVLVMILALGACGGKKDTGDKTETKTDAANQTESADKPAGDAGSLKCVTLADEGSGYKYDSVTIGTTVWGNFITGVTPAENDGACSLVFDVVFKVDPDTKEVKSDILEDWHFEDDTTLVMKMKDGITFSNGDKATAEDLFYSYSSHVDRSSAYTAEYGILYDECEVVDELTLRMKFSQFYSAFFTSYIIYLYDKSWCEEVGWDSMDWYKPVGSGPYACTEYVSDDHMTFVARDDYWNKDNDPVLVRQWTIKYYGDASTLFMDLETGAVAMAGIGSTSDYERFLGESNPGYDIYNGSAGVCHVLMFGFTENECWYDKRVRDAIAYGVPWDEFGEIVLGVTYQPAESVVPHDSPEFKAVGTYTYDVEKAKSLLKEAGYDESNPLKLKTVMMESPYYRSCCEAFQFYCEQIGVEFTFELKDISATINDWMTPGAGCEIGFYFDNFGSVDGQLVRSIDWAANPYGSTWTYIDEETFDKMYLEVAYETDTAERIKKSQDVQQYNYDNTLCVPFADMTFQVGYRPEVFGMNQIKLGVMNKDYYNLSNMSYASAWA